MSDTKPRGAFLSALVVRDLGNGRHVRLVQPFVYQRRDGTALNVPVGFITDYASIPRPARYLLPSFGKYNFAAVLHDYAFRVDSVPVFASSAEADRLMKEAMEDSPWPPNWWVRQIVYWGLRAGSRHFFHQHNVAWEPARE